MSVDSSELHSIAANRGVPRAVADSLRPPKSPPTPIVPPPRSGEQAASSEEDDFSESLSGRLVNLQSFLSSAIFHLTLFVVLALITERIREAGNGGKGSSAEQGSIDATTEKLAEEPGIDTSSLEEQNAFATPDTQELLDNTVLSSPDVTTPPPLDAAPLLGIANELPGLRTGLPGGVATKSGGGGTPDGDLDGALQAGATNFGNSLDGRKTPEGRARGLKEGGGTKESELAVASALEWLAEHQFKDGSWNFNHAKSPQCHNRCKHPGVYSEARIAATGLALLPFLGAGQTHREGKYAKQIDAGLRFLIREMKVEDDRGDLCDITGRMYGHGLASIALCEAYGMTKDSYLRGPAQSAVNFIVYAQDPEGGGWRYKPREQGDTSVVGWQLMALKSAHLAKLVVPPFTVRQANYFLDSVQSEEGAAYGYLGPGTGPATSSIGLLCRMYIGWKHEYPPLQRGVESIAALGPSIGQGGRYSNPDLAGSGMYYNYYATQVMHHYGGPLWTSWNNVMRDFLISSQGKKGHERGSWSFPNADLGSATGGRLYDTALAAMVLEVYYRHMPLYDPKNASESFFR